MREAVLSNTDFLASSRDSFCCRLAPTGSLQSGEWDYHDADGLSSWSAEAHGRGKSFQTPSSGLHRYALTLGYGLLEHSLEVLFCVSMLHWLSFSWVSLGSFERSLLKSFLSLSLSLCLSFSLNLKLPLTKKQNNFLCFVSSAKTNKQVKDCVRENMSDSYSTCMFCMLSLVCNSEWKQMHVWQRHAGPESESRLCGSSGWKQQLDKYVRTRYSHQILTKPSPTFHQMFISCDEQAVGYMLFSLRRKAASPLGKCSFWVLRYSEG